MIYRLSHKRWNILEAVGQSGVATWTSDSHMASSLESTWDAINALSVYGLIDMEVDTPFHKTVKINGEGTRHLEFLKFIREVDTLTPTQLDLRIKQYGEIEDGFKPSLPLNCLTPIQAFEVFQKLNKKYGLEMNMFSETSRDKGGLCHLTVELGFWGGEVDQTSVLWSGSHSNPAVALFVAMIKWFMEALDDRY